MSTSEFSLPELFAFDLDGTLLTTEKQITPETVSALREIHETGAKIVFASGRMAQSIAQYLHHFDFPVAVLALNGAEVFTDYSADKSIYRAPLSSEATGMLLDFEEQEDITLNFYIDGKLYARDNDYNKPWLQLYRDQTGSNYSIIDSFSSLRGTEPSKIIFVSSPEKLDRLQEKFTEEFGDSVYICRTWDYYLEFLSPSANKGIGLAKLAEYFHIPLSRTIAFGDAENDIPMFTVAAESIAPKNASDDVKNAATYISLFDNNQNLIPCEWQRIKTSG